MSMGPFVMSGPPFKEVSIHYRSENSHRQASSSRFPPRSSSSGRDEYDIIGGVLRNSCSSWSTFESWVLCVCMTESEEKEGGWFREGYHPWMNLLLRRLEWRWGLQMREGMRWGQIRLRRPCSRLDVDSCVWESSLLSFCGSLLLVIATTSSGRIS